MVNELPQILVVDDDDDVRGIVVELLQVAGYHVTWANGGEEMRAAVDQASSTVQVIVLDAAMPGEQGKSLALYAKQKGLAVVMVSGSHDAMNFATENNLQLLHKPFHSPELIEAISKAIASGQFGQRDA